jgi:hypothetical protein
VIACDQFTSQPDYWCEVEDFVDSAPSTLHLIIPEAQLDETDLDGRTLSVHDKMWRYLASGIFNTHEGMVYVERSVGGRTRKGLMLALDLERYDFRPGSQTLIRATEGTIFERIHPRMRIREGALLELPHILVLIDDPDRTVIEPIAAQKSRLPHLYAFELMKGSGSLSGYLVDNQEMEMHAMRGLERLADTGLFAHRYGLHAKEAVMLFAMGDGNHSFATAKAIWDKIKEFGGSAIMPNHPARYALVEVENVHDEGLNFEPIHRVLFRLQTDLLDALQAYFGDRYHYTRCEGCADMIRRVDIDQQRQNQLPTSERAQHTFGLVTPLGCGIIEITDPQANLPVATLQNFLDDFLQRGLVEKIDYVHGHDIVYRLGQQPRNAGFYLPVIAKSELFKTVILDGLMPRKAFSMGGAHEKRFYMECRRIA